MRSPVPVGDCRNGSHHRNHADPADRVDAATSWPLWRRRALHAVLIACGWVLFAWSWQRVTADRPEVGELRVLMVAAVVVVPLLTLSWVAHNVRIHRRKGPRKAGRPVPLRYEQDFNGRSIDADFVRLARSRRIDIVIEADVKRYVDADPAAPEPERPARALETA